MRLGETRFETGQLLSTGPYYPGDQPGHTRCDIATHAVHGRHYHCGNCGGAGNYQGHMMGDPPAFRCPPAALAGGPQANMDQSSSSSDRD